MRLAPTQRNNLIARKEKPVLGRRGIKRKAPSQNSEEAKVPATLKQMDGFSPVWGHGTKVKAWRVWCNWEGTEDEWTAELVNNSSLLPEQRKKARNMMQERKTKVIFPWPTMKARRDHLKKLGFRAYRPDKRGPWKCQKMSEFNDEDGMDAVPYARDETHDISVHDFTQKTSQNSLFFNYEPVRVQETRREENVEEDGAKDEEPKETPSPVIVPEPAFKLSETISEDKEESNSTGSSEFERISEMERQSEEEECAVESPESEDSKVSMLVNFDSIHDADEELEAPKEDNAEAEPVVESEPVIAEPVASEATEQAAEEKIEERSNSPSIRTEPSDDEDPLEELKSSSPILVSDQDVEMSKQVAESVPPVSVQKEAIEKSQPNTKRNKTSLEILEEKLKKLKQERERKPSSLSEKKDDKPPLKKRRKITPFFTREDIEADQEPAAEGETNQEEANPVSDNASDAAFAEDNPVASLNQLVTVEKSGEHSPVRKVGSESAMLLDTEKAGTSGLSIAVDEQPASPALSLSPNDEPGPSGLCLSPNESPEKPKEQLICGLTEKELLKYRPTKSTEDMTEKELKKHMKLKKAKKRLKREIDQKVVDVNEKAEEECVSEESDPKTLDTEEDIVQSIDIAKVDAAIDELMGDMPILPKDEAKLSQPAPVEVDIEEKPIVPIDVNATEKDGADETQDEFSLTSIQEITSIAEESVINDSVAKEDTLELVEDSASEPVVSSAKNDTLELMMEPAKDKADESLSGLALPELDCTGATGEEFFEGGLADDTILSSAGENAPLVDLSTAAKEKDSEKEIKKQQLEEINKMLEQHGMLGEGDVKVDEQVKMYTG